MESVRLWNSLFEGSSTQVVDKSRIQSKLHKNVCLLLFFEAAGAANGKISLPAGGNFCEAEFPAVYRLARESFAPSTAGLIKTFIKLTKAVALVYSLTASRILLLSSEIVQNAEANTPKEGIFSPSIAKGRLSGSLLELRSIAFIMHRYRRALKNLGVCSVPAICRLLKI